MTLVTHHLHLLLAAVRRYMALNRLRSSFLGGFVRPSAFAALDNTAPFAAPPDRS